MGGPPRFLFGLVVGPGLLASFLSSGCGGRATLRNTGGEVSARGEPTGSGGPDGPLTLAEEALADCYESCDEALSCSGPSWDGYSDAECRDGCDETTAWAENEECEPEWAAYIDCGLDEFECRVSILESLCPTEAENFLVCLGL